MSESSRVLPWRAIAIAAVITLGVSLLRYYGELQQWNPTVFNRDGGGGMAPLGIAWLVIPFGFWFGRLLARAGHGPAQRGRAALWCVLAFLLVVGLFAAVVKLMPYSRTRAVVLSVGACAIGLLAFRAWPRAWLANVAYGLLARIPVVVLQYVSSEKAQDTHYAKGPPGAPAEDLLFLLTTAQLTVWPFAYTAILGGLFAALGAMTVRK
jgi:hypothetical protein